MLYEELFKKNKDKIISTLAEYIKFQSISSDPKYFDECVKCAKWLEGYFTNIGLKSKIIKTNGNPFVYAEYIKDPKLPTILFYGHYDVQPADPLELWDTDPFKLEIKDEVIYCRGAMDQKGQLIYCSAAIEDLIKDSELAVNIKILVEGEEESGSSSLIEELDNLKDLLKSDLLIIMDSSMLKKDTPTVTIGLRGIIGFDIKVTGANSDLHSGAFGGGISNPAFELSSLISKMYDKDGFLDIKEINDLIIPATKEELEYSKKLNPDKELFKSDYGVYPREDFLYRSAFLPTISINGISSGYSGKGSKTIIPATATAKCTIRTVAGMNNENTVEAIDSFINQNSSKELKTEIIYHDMASFPIKFPIDSSVNKQMNKFCRSVFNKDIVYNWIGASIPITGPLSEFANDTILSGFGLRTDNLHAPNEHFEIKRMMMGYCFIREILKEYKVD